MLARVSILYLQLSEKVALTRSIATTMHIYLREQRTSGVKNFGRMTQSIFQKFGILPKFCTLPIWSVHSGPDVDLGKPGHSRVGEKGLKTGME